MCGYFHMSAGTMSFRGWSSPKTGNEPSVRSSARVVSFL